MAVSPAAAWTEQVVYSFCKDQPCPDGIGAEGALAMDGQGDIFGTTFDGGFDGSGVVWRLEPEGRKFVHSTLWKLDDTHGATPASGVIIDKNGNLYGAAPIGGASNAGVVFELVRKSNGRFTPVTLYDFCQRTGCVDGKFSVGGLAYAGQASGAPYDGKSPLYGTTNQGGANGGGAVYELVAKGKQRRETVIYNLCSQTECSDGDAPDSGLVVDQQGNLFGVTTAGGNAENAGVIFKLAPDGKDGFTQSVLYAFCTKKNCADGAEPRASLTLDANGDLFGTTAEGGAYDTSNCEELGHPGCGTVFELRGSNYNVLYSFCADQDLCSDGYQPYAAVTLDAKGDLFGTASLGGNADSGGTAFGLSGKKFTLLHTFCSKASCADGELPLSPLLIDSSGNLFGSTYAGGKYGPGSVYELKP
jgi:uncharacterized repeat protein (TIGR03803 family)